MTVDVMIEDDRWKAAGLERLAERAVAATLTFLDLEPDAWDVSVLGCDDTRIAALNADFRGKTQPTNVLSWPSEERGAEIGGHAPEKPHGDPELGDIALAYETCEREAAELGRLHEDHIQHLIVHGLLHLLGYDHVRDGDGDLMESLETGILLSIGVPDPY